MAPPSASTPRGRRPFLTAAALAAAFLAAALSGVESVDLDLQNNCKETVWPGIQNTDGGRILTGTRLNPGEVYILGLPPNWSGRIWGRQGCSFDSSGRGRCTTGDCDGVLYCNGRAPIPPVTLAEIRLNFGSRSVDFYNVSVVNGYNIGVLVEPQGGRGTCGCAGCVSDMNKACPRELAILGGPGGRVVACRSACMVFGKPEYCCTGKFGSPETCRPTAYSRLFKSACPTAYTYAYDDSTNWHTCSTAGAYVVTFCPYDR
ncbi:Thaumatin-like protein [Apostasia shenzhenica]|uniref:Thaumatin-like protein n=1 Tax=Apostasia shenzhenica TaxID=1088818 RepID=A0A2I0BCY6_9ASPA|nr:Thaumatin-like protein [Apostasia shenzhenica]